MKTTGMKHQIEGLEFLRGKRNAALLMEQGTGKTWLTLADAERLYEAGIIDAVFILAPKGVHTNWIRREIPEHVSAPHKMYVWRGKPESKKAQKLIEQFFEPWRLTSKPPLLFMAMNIEAIIHKHGFETAMRFVQNQRTLCVVDESTRIKNQKSKRSIKAKEIGQKCIARRILSGTIMPKSPIDLYSQYDFLKPGILRIRSLAAFTVKFAVLMEPEDPEMQAILRNLAGKVKGIPQVVKKDTWGQPMWRNLQLLSDLIAPHSFRKTKAECLDLPPKVYKPLYFELSSKQRQIYSELEQEHSYVHHEGGEEEELLFAPIAARMKRKQVTSGFINVYGEPVLMPPKDNPRMEIFKEVIDGIEEELKACEKQIIVWAMFKQEIEDICKELQSRGISFAKYTGETEQNERERIIDTFQAGGIAVAVANPQAMGIGVTLTAADTAIYYSCSYDNELRLQSEDRCHRIGTKKTVTYIDIIAEDTIDEDILLNLENKDKVSSFVIDRSFEL